MPEDRDKEERRKKKEKKKQQKKDKQNKNKHKAHDKTTNSTHKHTPSQVWRVSLGGDPRGDQKRAVHTPKKTRNTNRGIRSKEK